MAIAPRGWLRALVDLPGHKKAPGFSCRRNLLQLHTRPADAL
ncbi:hypothetical protein SC09_contig10orf00043 [Bacillus subtilis]|uniref:Uncharacterized protein n=1 Tax=Bacillus subtilis TaxID=1423 RepID=A0A0D1IL56_BACIU|nr:hypothetical protein SC09_contig10orf00043 [Bacillus subtilis]